MLYDFFGERRHQSIKASILTAISSIVNKNDCVVCLPTGNGKSFIFLDAP